MKVFEVNVYIVTSIRAPKVGKAAGMWLIEFITSSDVPETREGTIYREKTTENALVLELLIAALQKLTKTCLVSVNTECGHILSAAENRWIMEWEAAGWVNKKRKPVANRELWQELSGLLKRHSVEFARGWHSYKPFMENQIRKIQEEQNAKTQGYKKDGIQQKNP